MELLHDLIEGRTPPARSVKLPSELVVRRSCGAPAALRTPELGRHDTSVDDVADGAARTAITAGGPHPVE